MALTRKILGWFICLVLLCLAFIVVTVNYSTETRGLNKWRGRVRSVISRSGALPNENASSSRHPPPHRQFRSSSDNRRRPAGAERPADSPADARPRPRRPRPGTSRGAQADARQKAKDSVEFVMFTSWMGKPHKRVIHDNVLRTWPLISPNTACLLFSEQEEERKRVEAFGWYGLPFPNTSCEGVPILREMVFVAMRMFPKTQLFAYANGDLLFGEDLGVTLQHVLRQPLVNTSPLLLLAHRDNLPFTKQNEVNLTDLKAVPDLHRRAKLLKDGSSDIFMTNRLFPWRHTPDIVVGRVYIGLALVAESQVLNVTIVDMSPTVTVLHMTSSAGNKESSKCPNRYCNIQMVHRSKVAARHFKPCTYITCASYRSVGKSVAGNNVTGVELVPVKAKEISPSCSRCRFNPDVLLTLNYTG